MHSPGQNAVEVRHQLDIVAVVRAKLREVVGETLASGEMLLECRKAAAERMPARVDDLRVGKHEMNEPNMCEVVRHLVDKEGRGRLAMNPGAREVLLTQSTQLIRAKRLQSLGIASGLAALRCARQRPCDD